MNDQNLLEYFENFAKKKSTRNWLNSYYWSSISKICDYFIDEDSSVLEIGCGQGHLLGKLKAKDKMGIDFSQAMIKKAKENFSNIEFQTQRAENFQIDKKFDVIILSNLVGYLDDIQLVLNNLHAISHFQTKIIVTFYSKLWEPVLKLGSFLGLKSKNPNQNWLSTDDLNNILYISGFEVYRNHLSLLLPINIPIVSFLFNKVIAKLPLLKYLCLNHFAFAKLAPINTKDAKECSVTVVVPARNESGHIESAILRTPDMGKGTELIFVEGNSTDDTWEVINKFYNKYKNTRDIKITQQEGKGKADAVRKGYDMATGDILMILDGDLTVPPEDLPKFYEALVTNKGGFINGSRLVYPMEKKAMRFLNMLGNKFFSIVFSWMLDQPIKDTLCGTKVMFRSDYIKLKNNRKYFGEFDPFGDYDLIFGAYKLNLKIVDLPIKYRERVYGDTNISRFRHGLILLKMCLFAANKIKFRI